MANIFQKWRHNDLADDLAGQLGTIYTNCPLGSVWGGIYGKRQKAHEAAMSAPPDKYGEVFKKTLGLTRGTQLADVVDVRPSYTRFCIAIYEIKVSRADFLSDIRSDKWRGYLNHCHRFYFAVPSGLVKKSEIPDEAGLMVRGPRGWTAVVAATVLDTEIPEGTMMSMLFMRSRYSRRSDILQTQSYRESQAMAKQYGKETAKAFAKYRRDMELEAYWKARKAQGAGNG